MHIRKYVLSPFCVIQIRGYVQSSSFKIPQCNSEFFGAPKFGSQLNSPIFSQPLHATTAQQTAPTLRSQRPGLGHLQLLGRQQTIEDLHPAEVFHVLLNLPKLVQGLIRWGGKIPRQKIKRMYKLGRLDNHETINMPCSCAYPAFIIQRNNSPSEWHFVPWFLAKKKKLSLTKVCWDFCAFVLPNAPENWPIISWRKP